MPSESDEECQSGFNAETKSFKQNPTIENYVALRRKHPDATIEVAITGGLEWLFDNERKVKDFDIQPELVASSLDADQDAISELSLILMERIIDRKEMEASGQTHLASRGKAISDALVNYLIALMLDALSWNDDLRIPRELIVLLKERIGGMPSNWKKEQLRRDRRGDAIIASMQLLAENKEPSYRLIAEKIGVNATTVMRWFEDNEFIEIMKAEWRSKNKPAKGSTPPKD